MENDGTIVPLNRLRRKMIPNEEGRIRRMEMQRMQIEIDRYG